MSHKQNAPFFRALAVLVLIVMLFYLLLPRPAFSERENRPLAATPFSSIDPAGALSRYMRDRFPFRVYLVGGVAELSSRLFRESGGVLRVGDRLVAREDSFAGARFYANLSDVHALAEELSLPLTVLLVPRPVDVIAGRSGLYRSPSAGEAYAAIQSGDGGALSALLTSEDYYKTDHHLRESGVKKAADLLCSLLGKDTPVPTEMTRLSNFHGSAYRKSGLLFFASEPLFLPRFPNEEALTVTNAAGNTLPYYDERFFTAGDRYFSFFGGNHPVLTVTHKKEARERILVIRDSYASPVLPYLAQYYDVTAVDPRSFRGDIAALAKESGATRILLFSGVSLLADESFLLYFESSASSGSTSG